MYLHALPSTGSDGGTSSETQLQGTPAYDQKAMTGQNHMAVAKGWPELRHELSWFQQPQIHVTTLRQGKFH